MADVDRGQLLIITGLLIAVVFVGLALVVNSAVYTENLGSRDTTGEATDALEQQQYVEEQLSRTVDRTNTKNKTWGNETLAEKFRDSIENQSDAYTMEEASRGTDVRVDTYNLTNGTRLRQTNASRNFTSANGQTDWQLASGVEESGQFAVDVRNDSLLAATVDTTMSLLAESAFSIDLETSSGTWRIYLFTGAATESTYAVVEHPDQDFEDDGLTDRTNPEHVVAGWFNQSCSMEGDTVAVRLSEGTFGGAPCEEFDFYDDIDTHDIAFSNTTSFGVDRGNGTYDILIGPANFNDNAFEPAQVGDQPKPFHQSAMYAFDYSFTYQTASQRYRAPNRTVKPHEKDAGGILWQHPIVANLEAEEGGNSDEYDVDWTVDDRDGELDRVEIELIDRSAEATESEVESEVEAALNDDAYEEYLDDLYNLLGLGGIGDIIDDYMDDYNNVIGTPINGQTVDGNPVNANRVVDNETVSVGGASASGTTTVSHSGGTDYWIKVTVFDNSSRSTTAALECDTSTCEEVAG